MKKFTFQHETPDHFVMHNGVSHFHIAKKGLDVPTADKIRAFAKGGEVTQKDTDLAPPPEADLDSIYKPTELPEPEKQEKRRTIEEEMPEPEESKGNYAYGGKLTAKARAKIPQKNFALPNGRYPIEDASHARNALARVSQHGSPEEKAQVRSKVESKYPDIKQNFAKGGATAPAAIGSLPGEQSPELNVPMKFDDGGDVPASSTGEQSTLSRIGSAITSAFEPTPEPTPDPETERQAKYAKTRETNSANMKNGNYAKGGSIANETQDQAISRYADGNPATHTHHNGGKNQLHFHFYDGASPSPKIDEEPAHFDKGTTKGDVASTASDQVDPAPMMLDAKDIASTVDLPGQTPRPADISQQISDAADANAPSSDALGQVMGTIPKASVNAVSPAVNQIPASQQISAAPKASAPTPDQNPNLLSSLDKSTAQELSGIQAGANAQSEGFKQSAQAIGQTVLQQKAAADAYKLASDNLTKQNEQLFNSVSNGKVDPQHFWNSKTTGGKIAASIGLILGGIGGALNGTNVNVAMQQLNKHVQDDIEAQKGDISNKTNLYKMGLEKYRDQQSAQQFATLQSNALLQGTLQKIAAQTGNSQAQATAQQMIGQIGVQQTQLRSELAMKQAAMNVINQPSPATGGVNRDNLRLLVNSGYIPKEEVPTAMKEYGDYQKLSNILDHTDQVFKTAGQNANYRERISQSLPFGSHIPTVTDASKKYEAVTQDWLGNITKETEGRVTPTDVDLMRPSLPQPGDSPEVAATKINNIKDQIREKYAFPTLQENRLLHPNDPVSQPTATRNKRFTESKPR